MITGTKAYLAGQNDIKQGKIHKRLFRTRIPLSKRQDRLATGPMLVGVPLTQAIMVNEVIRNGGHHASRSLFSFFSCSSMKMK